ncbi:MAG: hypothetical protein LW806_08390 [Planctomycetaceae bacterium]|jgi:hypothetical protein|nr:hypothetical protein [Planctomycetaceae bacterium]
MTRTTSIATATSFVAAIMAASSLAGVGGGLSIDRSAIVSGGGKSSLKSLSLTGTIGQPIANSTPSVGGPYLLSGGFWNVEIIDAPCPADLDGDGSVGAADLSLLLASWGAAGEADLDGDGNVGAADLSLLLAAWGICD